MVNNGGNGNRNEIILEHQEAAAVTEITALEGHLIKRAGKWFKLKRISTRKEVWVEIDLKKYRARLKKLADRLAACPDVKLADVIKDVLNGFTLDDIDDVEKRLEKELVKEKPKVKTGPGCSEIRIGKNYALLVSR